MHRRSIPVAVMAALVSVLTVAVPAGAQSGDGPHKHCVAVVTDTTDGVLHTSAPVCFSSILDAAAYQPDSGGLVATSTSTTTIGWHFTGLNYSGDDIRIVGTTCSGGVWYATGIWNNNIESSFHYCGSSPTRFWDSGVCSSAYTDIYGSAYTLGGMNNRTSCVQYG